MSYSRKEKASNVNVASQQEKKQAISAVNLTNAVLLNFYGEGKAAINKVGYPDFSGEFPSMASIVYNDAYKTIVFDDSLRSAALAKGADVTRERMEAVKRRRCSLSLRRQCELLCIPRSSLYYAPIPEKPENLKMMSLMDTHLTSHPTEGVLSMVDWLQERGYPTGPKRVRRMFKLMGHETIYRRKNLTKGALRAYIKPYLLRGLKIDRANQVWFTDITYIPMARGFMYMTAYIDVYSRKIMGWGISNYMSKQWCMDVIEAAIAENGVPEIINSDQGLQYTSPSWTNYLEGKEIKILMDGKGRATYNIWIERFWKTIKYNHIHLNPCDTGLELYEGVQTYIEYNHQKKHQGTGMKHNDAHHNSLNQMLLNTTRNINLASLIF